MGEGSEETGIITTRLEILPWLSSVGLSLLTHSRNIPKISSLCWVLEIQFTHSSFQLTMLNDAPCSLFQVVFAAKSLQSCPTLCNPIDGSPPGSAVPGILQARTLEWVATSFSNAWKWKVKVKSLSPFRLLVTPWTAAYQAPLSMGFSRQEYWSGVPLPSPKLSLLSAKCPDADNGALSSGNGEEMSYNPLLEEEGNWEGLI